MESAWTAHLLSQALGTEQLCRVTALLALSLLNLDTEQTMEELSAICETSQSPMKAPLSACGEGMICV